MGDIVLGSWERMDSGSLAYWHLGDYYENRFVYPFFRLRPLDARSIASRFHG